jgi:hydroxyacylglutathione hydrolase
MRPVGTSRVVAEGKLNLMSTKLVPIITPAVNAFLLIGERVVVVDTLGPGGAKRVLGTLEKLGKTPKDVSLIVLTHGHTDQTGSAEELRERTKAPIALHWADLEMVQAGYEPTFNPTGSIARLLSRVVRRPSTVLTTDVMLEGSVNLDHYGVDAQIIETPGHTSGSVSVLVDGGQAVIADLLRGDFFREGRPDYPLFADSLSRLHSSVRSILRLPLHELHTSFGKPFTRENVQRRFNDVL